MITVMKNLVKWTLTFLAIFSLLVGFSQEKERKGTEPCFEAESVVESEIVGYVKEIVTSTCDEGNTITYIKLMLTNERTTDVFLGPLDRVSDIANKILGKKVTIKTVHGIETGELVAQYIILDKKKMVLRDEEYVPVWLSKKEIKAKKAN